MTPQERKVIELALEALTYIYTETTADEDELIDQAITAIKEALAQPEQEPVTYSGNGTAGREADARPTGFFFQMPKPVAQPEQDPEFIKHEVESAEDWSEWVCPNPHKYLMKCCDCGLVHEAQFGVVRYKSEDEREACDFVDDPNLQAVFRMRRSEQWSPEDTAHRAGGLPMAQPKQEQEPVVVVVTGVYGGRFIVEPTNSAMVLPVNMALYTHPPQRKSLTGEVVVIAAQSCLSPQQYDHFEALLENDQDAHNRLARAIEAAHGIKE